MKHPTANEGCRRDGVGSINEGPGLFEGAIGVPRRPVLDGVATVVALKGALDGGALSPPPECGVCRYGVAGNGAVLLGQQSLSGVGSSACIEVCFLGGRLCEGLRAGETADGRGGT